MTYEADKVFLTSDQHFGHARIIEFCDRPYKTIDEMDTALILNWNKVVPLDGHVFVVGDFSFHKPKRTISILNRLQGTKYLVKGNHDGKSLNGEVKKHFTWVHDLMQIEVADESKTSYGGDQLIVMCHFPFISWNRSHHGSWNAHGHTHGSMPDRPHALSMDVGVDPNDYTPVSYWQMKNHMQKKTWKAVDHHGAT